MRQGIIVYQTYVFLTWLVLYSSVRPHSVSTPCQRTEEAMCNPAEVIALCAVFRLIMPLCYGRSHHHLSIDASDEDLSVGSSRVPPRPCCPEVVLA